MGNETTREKWGGYIGLAFTIVPAMILSGFMPEWDVLPLTGWLAISGIGGATGGMVATPLTTRGAMSGALIGLGVLLGVWLYVTGRAALSGHHTFLKIELAIGALLGGLPGVILYVKWARAAS